MTLRGNLKAVCLPAVALIALCHLSACGQKTSEVSATEAGPDSPEVMRFKTDLMRRADEQLAAGRPDAALATINQASSSMTLNDPVLKALKAKIIERVNATSSDERADAVVERLNGYWTEKLAAIPIAAPATTPEILDREREFEEFARALEDGGADLDGNSKVVAARTEFRKAVQARQAVVFPKLRQAYGAAMDTTVWKENTRVTVQAKTITLTGYLFALNANIADTQSELVRPVSMLRFSKVEYRTYPGSSGGSYTLDQKNDSEVGYWDGMTFITVDVTTPQAPPPPPPPK